LSPSFLNHAVYLFPDDYFLLMQFCRWLRKQSAAEGLLQSSLWAVEKCLMCEGVFHFANSDLYVRGNPCVNRKTFDPNSFQCHFWADMVGDVVTSIF